MSIEACPSCGVDVDSAGLPEGGILRCDRCGCRFRGQNRRQNPTWSPADEDDELGIHPALAQRYRGHGKLQANSTGIEMAEPNAGAGLAPPAGVSLPGVDGPNIELSTSFVREQDRLAQDAASFERRLDGRPATGGFPPVAPAGTPAYAHPAASTAPPSRGAPVLRPPQTAPGMPGAPHGTPVPVAPPAAVPGRAPQPAGGRTLQGPAALAQAQTREGRGGPVQPTPPHAPPYAPTPPPGLAPPSGSGPVERPAPAAHAVPATRPGRGRAGAERPGAPVPTPPAASAGAHKARRDPSAVHPALAAKSKPAAMPKPRAPKPATGEPMPEIPGYKLIGLTGKGAMGRVYQGEHLASGRTVAVKILTPELAARLDFVRRFEREAEALRKVSHAGVVSIIESGESGGEHFLAMGFVDGPSLRRLLRRGKLEPLRAIRFTRQIVRALGAAHMRGVIHRDLKPENILVESVDERERLVVVDFGLAGILHEDEDPHPNLTRSRVTMGTVNYMAPEQRVDAKRVDQRADLYACGVMLYEFLTGDLPLGRFQLPAEKGLAVPAAIDDVIARALARKPEERYEDAAAFDRALMEVEEALVGTGESVVPADDTVPAPPPSAVHAARPASGGARAPAAVSGLNSGAGATRDASGSGAESAPGRTSMRDTAPMPTEADAPLLPAPGQSPAEGDAENLTDGPQWVTAPPWVRRPLMLWGTAAVVLGLGVGVFSSFGPPREVLVTADQVKAAPTAEHVAGPRPDVASAQDAAAAALAPVGDGTAQWAVDSIAWQGSPTALVYKSEVQGGSLMRRDLGLAVAPAALEASTVAFGAEVRLSYAQLPMAVGEARKKARELLGAAPDQGVATVMLADADQGRAVGFALFADGACSLVEFARKDGLWAFSRHIRSVCGTPAIGAPVALGVTCDQKLGECHAQLGDRPVTSMAVPGLGTLKLHPAVGCRNATCAFGPAGAGGASPSAAPAGKPGAK